MGHSTSAAVATPAQGNSPLPQLSGIESIVVDVENPTQFDDWLRRFEISLLRAALKISEKEKTMVLATKLLPNSVSAVYLKTLRLQLRRGSGKASSSL